MLGHRCLPRTSLGIVPARLFGLLGSFGRETCDVSSALVVRMREGTHVEREMRLPRLVRRYCSPPYFRDCLVGVPSDEEPAADGSSDASAYMPE